MAESVYKVIELIGTSTDSWEMAAKSAVERGLQKRFVIFVLPKSSSLICK